MSRRDERRQVLEAIAIEAPDQGTDDFSERGDRDDCQRLESDCRPLKREQPDEHRCGQRSEPSLSGFPDAAVEPQATNGPDGDGGEDEGRTAHDYIFADPAFVGSVCRALEASQLANTASRRARR